MERRRNGVAFIDHVIGEMVIVLLKNDDEVV